MRYRITQGDIEITKNVLMEASVRLYKELLNEKKVLIEKSCPSYHIYDSLLTTLQYIDNHKKDLVS